ncbi:MAG: methyltransferase domain-containing protein [Vicinamibacterales bacterium]
MSLFDFSFSRPIGSYSKVQGLVSKWKRNQPSQLRSPRVAGKEYLDLGCGPNTHPGFINLDYDWQPGVDLCWDLARGLALPDGSMKGVFSEHCLEHFSLPTVRFLLAEIRRVLRPGGVVRIVVPDAGLYLDLYARRRAGEATADFPYEDAVRSAGLTSPLASVNRVFYVDRDSPAGHRCMFDADLMTELLGLSGFEHVRREQFRTGRDPKLLIDAEHRNVESLYMEASAG